MSHCAAALCATRELPALFVTMFKLLYTATSYYLSADPSVYGEAGRTQAKNAIEQYGRIVWAKVLCV